MPKKEIKELDFNIERDLEARGYGRICGIDEAGRGPLCGPVVAAACLLPMDAHIEGLNDSKKLTPQKRDLLFDIIKATAYDYAIAEASVEEIDELNILGDYIKLMPAQTHVPTLYGVPVPLKKFRRGILADPSVRSARVGGILCGLIRTAVTVKSHGEFFILHFLSRKRMNCLRYIGAGPSRSRDSR